MYWHIRRNLGMLIKAEEQLAEGGSSTALLASGTAFVGAGSRETATLLDALGIIGP